VKRWFLIVAVAILVLFFVSRGEAAVVVNKYDPLFRLEGGRRGVCWLVLRAIACVESSYNPRAFNSAGIPPPVGKPALRHPIPEGVDVTGYQGSFGLMGIYHTDTWSTARRFRPGGQYPIELLDPGVSIEIAAAYLEYLQGRGFVFPRDADVYNMGEKEWAAGRRNPAYKRQVDQALNGIVGC
jgi:hypothetical protein